MGSEYVYKPMDSALTLHVDGQGSRRLDTNVSDLSGNGNHGIVSGVTYKTSPSGKSVLSFDGIDDYIRHSHTRLDEIPGLKLILLSSGNDIKTSNGLLIFLRN